MDDIEIKLQELHTQKKKFLFLLKKNYMNQYAPCLEYARQEVYELSNEILILEQALICIRCNKINNIIR